MPTKLNLLGSRSKCVTLSNNTCESIATLLADGEGVPVHYTRANKMNVEFITFISKDGRTEWVLECGVALVTVTKSSLRNRGEGTWSKVMALLKRTAQTEIFSLVLRNVRDPGTSTWCESNKFTQMEGSDDYIYKWERSCPILVEKGDDFRIV